MSLRRPELKRTLLVLVLAMAALMCLGVGRADAPPRPVLAAQDAFEAAPPTTVEPALPVRLDLPSIGVSTPLIELGLTAIGALETPAVGPDYDLAGWYRGSPRPGALGPAVIAGHVDSARNGPSVFYRLRWLRPGDVGVVTTAEGAELRFVVDTIRGYAKAEFPTAAVYGDTQGSELRLITCGGDFDRSSGHYLDNTVVSAHLVTRNRTPYQVVVKASNAKS